MKKSKKTPTPKSETIPFSRNDYERLQQIVDFLLGLSDAFGVNEVGHHVEYISVHALVRPGYLQAQAFLDDIAGRLMKVDA